MNTEPAVEMGRRKVSGAGNTSKSVREINIKVVDEIKALVSSHPIFSSLLLKYASCMTTGVFSMAEYLI